jgi:hypothetical protein
LPTLLESDPDPQGVVYKGFSRNSNVIKERINDGKPKRSKSFQQTREREFARGKSLSSRHLSLDTEDQNSRQIIRNIDNVETESERNFRPASKSLLILVRYYDLMNRCPLFLNQCIFRHLVFSL